MSRLAAEMRAMFLRSTITIVGLVAVWYVISASVGDPDVVPSPIDAWYDGVASLGAGVWWVGATEVLENLIITCLRTVAGALLGLVMALTIVMMLTFFFGRHIFLDTIFAIIRGIPLLALIPLFVYWFGNSEILGVLLYIALAVFILASVDGYFAASGMRGKIKDFCIVVKAKQPIILRVLVFPLVVFNIGAGLVLTVGLSWAFTLGAELVVSKNGIGMLLRQAYQQHDMSRMWLFVTVYALLGWAAVKTVRVAMRGRML